VSAIENGAAHWTSNLGQNVWSGVGSLLGGLGSSVLVIVLSFLMLVEGPEWLKRLWGVYNDEERMESHRQIAHRMYSVVTGYVTGQLIVSAIDSTVVGIFVFVTSLFFKQVPTDLTLPAVAIAFTLSLIPLFGSTVGSIIIALLLASYNFSAGVIYELCFIVYLQIESNVIAPVIQSKKVELSALAVLASVTIGIYVFGLPGGIISVPIAGCIKVLLEEYLIHARKNRAKSERPISRFVKKLQGEDI
jgi:predicted PurR-regulated permease PerM